MKSKVAILGTGSDWKDAPFFKSDWEIWACNRAGLGQNFDRLFEIHQNWDYEGPLAKAAYLKDLEEIYSHKQLISVVPLGSPSTNLIIDRAAMFEKYGAMWFSSSFAFMIAHALDNGVEEIAFYGVDLESTEEYIVQFAGVRHLIDLAKALKVKITIADRSILNRQPQPYPDRFETTFAYTLEKKAARIKKLIEQVEVDHEKMKSMVSYSIGENGAIAELRDKGLIDATSLREVDEILDRNTEQLEKFTTSARATLKNLLRLEGELSATQYYKRIFVWNALPPEIGDVEGFDPNDCGPI